MGEIANIPLFVFSIALFTLSVGLLVGMRYGERAAIGQFIRLQLGESAQENRRS